MFSGGKRNKSVIEPVSGIQTQSTVKADDYSPISSVQALPLIVPVPDQPYVDPEEEINTEVLNSSEEPTYTEDVNPEDLEILSEIQAESQDVNLEEEFLPFDDTEMEVNEGGLSIEDIVSTVDMAADAVAVDNAGGSLDTNSEDNLIQAVTKIEENDFWENMLIENPELSLGLETIKKRVYERHGKDINDTEKFDLDNLKEKSAKAALLEDNSIDDLMKNWQA